MVIIDVQRAGPSTGMPTKTEQSDLLQALHGRHGESPLPVVAARDARRSASTRSTRRSRIAVSYRTPVILLSDLFLANSSEPWRIPGRSATCRRSTRDFATDPPEDAVPALRARRRTARGRGPSRARPGSRTASAAWRSRTAPARSPTTAPTTRDDRAAPAKVAGIDGARPRGRRATTAPSCSCSAGARATARSAPARGGCATRGGRVATAHLRHLQPAAGEHRRGAAPLRARARAGDEHAASSRTSCGPVPGRRRVATARSRASRCSPSRDSEQRDHEAARAEPTLTKADFQSDQETRWCPGCGDYAVLAAVQGFLPELGHPARAGRVRVRHRLRRALRLLHGHVRDARHPRPRARARDRPGGARDDLSIWVVTGDGDALSIGGNHLIHALRRNVPVKILLFNNQIYGLTKGQASPTSERRQGDQVDAVRRRSTRRSTRSSLALGAEATFVARTIDRDKQHLPTCCAPPPSTRARRSSRSTRTARCSTTARSTRCARRTARLQPHPARARRADPLRRRGEHGVARGAGRRRCEIVGRATARTLVVHDAHRDDPSLAFALARLASARTARRRSASSAPSSARCSPPTTPSSRRAARPSASAELDALLRGGDTWTVGA